MKGSKVSKPTRPAGRRSNAAREITAAQAVAAARAVTARIGACMCMRRSPICPGAPGGPLRPTGPSAPRSPSRPTRPAGPGGPAGPCRRRPLPRVRGGGEGGRRRSARGRGEAEAKSPHGDCRCPPHPSRTWEEGRRRQSHGRWSACGTVGWRKEAADGQCAKAADGPKAYKWLHRIAQYRGGRRLRVKKESCGR